MRSKFNGIKFKQKTTGSKKNWKKFEKHYFKKITGFENVS